MKNTSSGCYSCTIKSRAVEKLNKEELDFLESNCAEITLKSGEYIIKEGALSSHIAYMKTGLVKIHMTGPRGKDQILKIATPGSYIGLQTILAHKTHQYSASALIETTICNIDLLSFRELISKNPDFANELILFLCQEETGYFNRFVNQMQKQVNGRIADAILYFSKNAGDKSDFTIPLSRSDLSALIGATRESVARSLKELSDTGVIKVQGRLFQIVNHEMLYRISRSG